MKHEDFMATALDLARLGLGKTSPNPAVGAVVVRGGKILGKGFHRGPGFPHAEIEALTSPPAPLLIQERVPRPAKAGLAGEVWKGATLYITLEPCCPPKPGGRTPPCTDAIIKSGIREVVVGMRDPDPRMRGRGIAVLKRAGIQVRVGVLERECRALNEAYVMHRTKKRPFVILKMAATLDGKVGILGRRRKITGPEAEAHVHTLRDRVDAILVGIGTVLSDNPRLTARTKGSRAKDPIRIILDSRRRRIPPSARLLKLKSSAPTWAATSLTKKRSAGGRVELKSLLRELARRGVVTLLVEGGPTVWRSFFQKRLVDRVVLLIAPKRLGPQGIPALPGPIRGLNLSFSSLCRLGPDLLLEGTL